MDKKLVLSLLIGLFMMFALVMPSEARCKKYGNSFHNGYNNGYHNGNAYGHYKPCKKWRKHHKMRKAYQKGYRNGYRNASYRYNPNSLASQRYNAYPSNYRYNYSYKIPTTYNFGGNIMGGF